MFTVLSATLPIFLIICVGALVVRADLLTKDHARAFGTFVLNVAMPCLIFRSIALRPVSEVLNPSYLIAATLGAFLTTAIVYLAARMLGRAHLPALVRGMGACLANSGYVGYPVAVLFMGPPAGLALALSLTVENLIILPVLLALADAAAAQASSPGRTLLLSLRSVARNPLMLAMALGLAVSIGQIPVPAAVMKSVDLFATASTALALTAIGGSLVGIRPTGMAADMTLMVAGKLLLHPALVAGMLWFLPPLPADLHKALIIFSAAPMMAIFPLFASRYGEGETGAAAAFVAVSLSFLTMSAIIALL
jgi:malonate transporter